MITTQNLASYATHPNHSKGRLIAEEESQNRTPYQRDRDRIAHSAAFRRLEYKTQVFVNHEGDHYRTRLTHTIEVAQIARTLSRVFNLNEDLAEALALAHDLGHPAFGHAGETALNEVMKPYGGFDHNAHTLKILTHLEQRYAHFDGLNMTWETLEGVVKHNGPLISEDTEKARKSLPTAIYTYDQHFPLALHQHASLEAQIAAISDDIAYNNHDLEDGLRAELFTIEDLFMIPFIGEEFRKTVEKYPFLPRERVVHEAIRSLVNQTILDLITQTFSNIDQHRIETVNDIRTLGKTLVTFSEEMEYHQQQLKQFLMKNMYRHHKVQRMASNAKRILQELFNVFFNEPECLPSKWYRLVHIGATDHEKATIVCDYIAGMTDRFALQEHDSLFKMTPQTSKE